MWRLAIRTLLRRWGSGMLVLLELTIGFFALSVASSMAYSLTAITRHATAFAPLQSRIVGTYQCPPAKAEAGLSKLRQSFEVGAFYIKLQNDIGIDAQTAVLFPLQVADGRWLQTADFSPADGAIPTVLGAAAHPGLTVGSRIPGTDRTVVGRLRQGQTLITPSLPALDALVSTDQLVLTPSNVESTGSLARFVIFPREGRAAALSAVPAEFTACLNGSNTLGEDLSAYYKSKRPLMIVMGFMALVVLIIATLGFVGVGMMTVEKRTREFAIRLSVGATKASLVIQLLGEMLLLSLLASMISTPAAWLAGRALNVTVTPSLMVLVNLCGVLLGIVAAAGPVVTMLRRPPVFFIRSGR